MPEELNDKTFETSVLKHKGVVIVDFWAEWCGPCKMLAPVFEKLSKEFGDKVKFAKINVDDYSDVAQKYGVMSIPCVIFFKNGDEVDRLIGFHGDDVLRSKISKYV